MAEPRGAPARIPFLLLAILLLIAAVIGGVVARMLPVAAGSTEAAEPRALAVPAEDSLSPLVKKTAQAVEVGLKDGRKIAAEPVALAPELDLAVLKIDAKDLPSLKLGDSSKLEVGDYVVAIGNPFNLGQTVTSGIISAIDRPLGRGDSRRFLQTDAPINPGNSGGPLIDLDGNVIGINSALFSPSQSEASAGNVGIGFAIPSNDVKKLLAVAERRVSQ